jgi:hypothetical protein
MKAYNITPQSRGPTGKAEDISLRSLNESANIFFVETLAPTIFLGSRLSAKSQGLETHMAQAQNAKNPRCCVGRRPRRLNVVLHTLL